MTRYHIGTSGWHYADWRDRFYPEKLSKSRWLDFYSRHFPTVEVNNSFYRLPSEAAFTGWYGASPEEFTFAVKVSRFITHIKRLKECDEPVNNFMSRATLLKEKLGPLLYQLPPSLHRDDDRLAAFLSILPKGLKHVIEFRHASWLDEGVFAILREYDAGLCVFDMPEITCPLLSTSGFAYIRFHGSDSLYAGCYTDEELAEYASKIKEMAGTLDEVYIYFNNDIQGFALRNAETIRGYLEEGTEK